MTEVNAPTKSEQVLRDSKDGNGNFNHRWILKFTNHGKWHFCISSFILQRISKHNTIHQLVIPLGWF